MFHVREDDVVVMRIANESGEVHPMHLHGHHVLVLSRDGKPAARDICASRATGSKFRRCSRAASSGTTPPYSL